ncbi:MAG TPA: isocitrate/isopropylmalate dehydrogenase family protein [Candidatus Methylomirabilis sp.]|nr:isocitrate/isopropylmalate dehydrogenase family protein [Candidatus Methylomirabilis sp.]
MTTYSIAVVKGDGIGPEVCSAAIEVIRCALGSASRLEFCEYPAGASHYRKAGNAFPEETFEGCRSADAILHGAAGLPGVLLPDGTEAGPDFGLKVRSRLDLYANVRPIRLWPGLNSPLRRYPPGRIDYVVIRENTEGLYASRGAGAVLREEVAADTLMITRKGTERVVRFAFDLARKRSGAPLDGRRRVTACDKSNVLRSYAFFRRVFNEIAARYPDVAADSAYVDAMTVHLVNRPDFYDVIVAENMFGDIISDLGAATVGSMGMSPTAELGDHHGFFQAAHGSAPDIMGQGIANPLGTILAGSLMLTWLGERRHDPDLCQTAQRIEHAVESVLSSRRMLPRDLGGRATTAEMTRSVCEALG